jgi:hypothetical protein
VISPDPFDGGSIAFRVLARRIPARRYRDDGDLNGALAAAIPLVVEGKARGVW